MTRVLQGLTADMLAHGLIAASEIYGVNPTFVFGKGDAFASAARQCVARSVLRLMERKPNARDGAVVIVARLLKINPNQLAPSGLKRPAMVNDIQRVATVLADAGLSAITIIDHGKPAQSRKAGKPESQAAPTSEPWVPEPHVVAAFRAEAEAEKSADTLTVRMPVRGHAGTFDPAVLGERKSAAPAPVARGRQADVNIRSDDTLAAMFAGDQRLVRLCQAQGGFPIEYRLPTGEKVLGTADKRRWEHRA